MLCCVIAIGKIAPALVFRYTFEALALGVLPFSEAKDYQHLYTYIYIYMCMYVYMCVYMCMYVYVHIQIHIYIYMYIHIHIYIYRERDR